MALNKNSYNDLIWILNNVDKSNLIESQIQEEILNIIKMAEFLQCPPEVLILKQGEKLNRMYILLMGKVSIFQTNPNLTELDEIIPNMLYINPRKQLRNQLGTFIKILDKGFSFGEISLLRKDSSSIASLITDEQSHFLIVNRTIFSANIEARVSTDLKEKLEFFQNCGYFKDCSENSCNHLILKTQKEKLVFGQRLFQQGSPFNNIYLVYRGEIKLFSQNTGKKSTNRFRILENRVLSSLNHSDKNTANNNYDQSEKISYETKQYIKEWSLIGKNEIIGAMEILFCMKQYQFSAISSMPSELFCIKPNDFIDTIHPLSIASNQIMEQFIQRVEWKVNITNSRIQSSELQILLERLNKIYSNIKIKEFLNEFNREKPKKKSKFRYKTSNTKVINSR